MVITVQRTHSSGVAVIHEAYMQQGSYQIPLVRETPPSVFAKCVEYGHTVVTSQWLDINLFTDAVLLATARYAGPVLVTERDLNGYSVEGVGMVWHLGGDEGEGPADLETPVTFTAATATTVLAAAGLLPPAVTAGTITTTGINTYSGYHGFESPLDAVRTYCKTVGGHFRVSPAGVLDFSAIDATSGNPYMVAPTVVVLREGFGSDPAYQGVPVSSAVTRRDVTRYRTRVALIQEQDDAPSYYALVSGSTRAAVYKDIHGNNLDRTIWLGRPASQDVDLDQLLGTELDERDIDDVQEVDTDQYEIVGGDFKIGDLFYIYDPPTGFIDLANEIEFRGSIIWPKKTRLLQASWPLADGMGVYYRNADGVYTDLTRWIRWEA